MRYVNCTLTFINDHEAEYADDLQFYSVNKVTGKAGGDELGRRTIKKLNEWVQKHSDHCHRSELALLGLHLYRVAFDTAPDPPFKPTERPLKTAFEATYAKFQDARAKDPSTRLRMKLVFNREAQTLGAFPWEFLCMPEGDQGIFLAGRTELILTRSVPEEAWARSLEADQGDQTLRILIVKSAPRELVTVKADQVVEEIQKLKTEHIDVRVFADRPTLKRLREVISGSDEQPGYRPHIVHFMGHGRAGMLALVKEQAELDVEDVEAAKQRDRGKEVPKPEEAHWIDIETVKSLFIGHKPRVLFLHACEGAAPDSLDTFRSTAREIVSSDIPAVIAMQYEIGQAEAELFARTFYRQLRLGKDVDEAMTEARQQLGQTIIKPGRYVWDDRSFGTPVIYLQTERPIILPPPPKSAGSQAEETKGEPSPGRKVPCPNGCCERLVIYGKPFCTGCKKELMICPVCKEMMVVEVGWCDNGHQLGSAVASQPARVERGLRPDTDY